MIAPVPLEVRERVLRRVEEPVNRPVSLVLAGAAVAFMEVAVVDRCDDLAGRLSATDS